MKVQRPFDAANRFLLDHAMVGYLLWGLLLFFMADALLDSAPLDEPSEFGFLAWVVVAELLITPAIVLRLPVVMGAARDVLFLRWIVANVPIFFSLASVDDRAPQWLGALAVVEALLLMTYSLRQARRSLTGDDSGVGRL